MACFISWSLCREVVEPQGPGDSDSVSIALDCIYSCYFPMQFYIFRSLLSGVQFSSRSAVIFATSFAPQQYLFTVHGPYYHSINFAIEILKSRTQNYACLDFSKSFDEDDEDFPPPPPEALGLPPKMKSQASLEEVEVYSPSSAWETRSITVNNAMFQTATVFLSKKWRVLGRSSYGYFLDLETE